MERPGASGASQSQAECGFQAAAHSQHARAISPRRRMTSARRRRNIHYTEYFSGWRDAT